MHELGNNETSNVKTCHFQSLVLALRPQLCFYVGRYAPLSNVLGLDLGILFIAML